jgi:hypothetical protein
LRREPKGQMVTRGREGEIEGEDHVWNQT